LDDHVVHYPVALDVLVIFWRGIWIWGEVEGVESLGEKGKEGRMSGDDWDIWDLTCGRDTASSLS